MIDLLLELIIERTRLYDCRIADNSLIVSFFGTVTQLVILPPHIPWLGQGGGILLLSYSMIGAIGVAIFDYKWKGWEQITFYLAKLMTITHVSE